MQLNSDTCATGPARAHPCFFFSGSTKPDFSPDNWCCCCCCRCCCRDEESINTSRPSCFSTDACLYYYYYYFEFFPRLKTLFVLFFQFHAPTAVLPRQLIFSWLSSRTNVATASFVDYMIIFFPRDEVCRSLELKPRVFLLPFEMLNSKYHTVTTTDLRCVHTYYLYIFDCSSIRISVVFWVIANFRNTYSAQQCCSKFPTSR